MAGQRSRNGCWTCRLRRKKCDESRPMCSTCDGLGITCHGYGPRPEWMDGGEGEKRVAAETRRDIKNASRRERPIHPGLISPESEIRTPSVDTLERRDSRVEPIVREPDPGLPNSIQGREISLLMYYLDYVFLMQFRLYQPLIADGGRGWLLSLLLRCPPLYHMTLAITAQCLWFLRQNQERGPTSRASLAQVDLALHEMQEYIREFASQDGRGSLEDNIKGCASMLQMLAYTVFTGGKNDWYFHLKAAASCASVLTEALYTLPSLSSTPFTTDLDSATLATKEREAAIKFLVATYAWMDIMATTCTGKAPILELEYGRLLGQDKVNMSKQNGIANWVLLAIGRISSLYAWKREAKAAGRLSVIELVSRGTKIEKELNSRLAATSKVPSPAVISPEEVISIPLANLWTHSRYVTRIYASAALTYLHVVVAGPHPELPEVRNSVINSIELLKQIPEPTVVRAIYWAIYITGSMAIKEEEEIFRDLMASAGITAGSIGSGWNMLQVLEQCWRTRDKDYDLGEGYWVNVMESIGERVLIF